MGRKEMKTLDRKSVKFWSKEIFVQILARWLFRLKKQPELVAPATGYEAQFEEDDMIAQTISTPKSTPSITGSHNESHPRPNPTNC